MASGPPHKRGCSRAKKTAPCQPTRRRRPDSQAIVCWYRRVVDAYLMIFLDLEGLFADHGLVACTDGSFPLAMPSTLPEIADQNVNQVRRPQTDGHLSCYGKLGDPLNEGRIFPQIF